MKLALLTLQIPNPNEFSLLFSGTSTTMESQTTLNEPDLSDENLNELFW